MCVNPGAAVAKRDFPFSREENPLASQLIFLAEVVGAKIAAAAASAAMQELFEKDSIIHQELLCSAAVAAGLQVPAPTVAVPGQAAGGAATSASAADSEANNGAAPMEVDGPAAAAPAANGAVNGVNGHLNENVVQDVAAAIPPERLHAASAAAFLGAGTKAKLLAEAEGVLLSGHAMTVLECMTQKMIVKSKYLNDVENEIFSVHSKLVETRANALKARDSIATKKELLKKEKQLLAAAEKRHREELAADGMLLKSDDARAAKKPASGEPPGGAVKVAKTASNATTPDTPAVAPAGTPAAPAAPAPTGAAAPELEPATSLEV